MSPRLQPYVSQAAALRIPGKLTYEDAPLVRAALHGRVRARVRVSALGLGLGLANPNPNPNPNPLTLTLTLTRLSCAPRCLGASVS